MKRPLNTNEVSEGLLMCTSIHYLIRGMDRLSHTTLFKQKVKQTGKAFLAELERHQTENVWCESPEGTSFDGAVNQMENLTDMFHKLMTLCLAMDYLPESDQSLFWVDLEKTFKRFNIPLRMTPTGELELRP